VIQDSGEDCLEFGSGEARSWAELKEQQQQVGRKEGEEEEDGQEEELYLDICEAYYLSYALGNLVSSFRNHLFKTFILYSHFCTVI